MLTRIAAATGLALALAVAAAPAASAGEVCYDVNVTVQGASVVAEKGCQPVG